MKKIIIAIISAMILMPTMADAQIQKTRSYSTKTIKSVRTGFITLYHSDCYWLGMSTTNQFDQAILIKLGETKEIAIQSLKDLIEIYESLKSSGGSQYITNGWGEELRTYKIGMALCFSAPGRAGYANMSKGEMEKFITALEKE